MKQSASFQNTPMNVLDSQFNTYWRADEDLFGEELPTFGNGVFEKTKTPNSAYGRMRQRMSKIVARADGDYDDQSKNNRSTCQVNLEIVKNSSQTKNIQQERTSAQK